MIKPFLDRKSDPKYYAFERNLLTCSRLINVLKAANQRVPEALLKFGTTVKKKAHDAYGAFYKDLGESKKATKITFDD
jgi:hypothetical protein